MSLWLWIKRKLMEWEVAKVTDLDLHAAVSEAMDGAVLTGPPRGSVVMSTLAGAYETITFAGDDPQELVDFLTTTLVDACVRSKELGDNCMIWRVKPSMGVEPILDSNFRVLDWKFKIRCRVVWGRLAFKSL